MADIAQTFQSKAKISGIQKYELTDKKLFEDEINYSPYRPFNHPIYGRVELFKENFNSRLIMGVTVVIIDKEEASELIERLRIRKNLNHSNLLYMLDYSCTPSIGLCSSHYTITSFFEFPLTNLEKDVKEQQVKAEYYRPEVLTSLILQMLDVLEHLHNVGLYHGNVSPKTIQHRKSTNKFVLLDHFGEKRSMENFYNDQIIFSDDIFLSPEQYKVVTDNFNNHENQQKETSYAKGDIFSLGMVVLYLGLMKSVQDVYTPEGQVNREKLAAHMALFEQHYGTRRPPLCHVLKLMLTYKPDDRPLATELKSTFKIGLATIGCELSLSRSKEKSSSMFTERYPIRKRQPVEQKTEITKLTNFESKNDLSISPLQAMKLENIPEYNRFQLPTINSAIETNNDDFFNTIYSMRLIPSNNYFDMPEQKSQTFNHNKIIHQKSDLMPRIVYHQNSQVIKSLSFSERVRGGSISQGLSQSFKYNFVNQPNVTRQLSYVSLERPQQIERSLNNQKISSSPFLLINDRGRTSQAQILRSIPKDTPFVLPPARYISKSNNNNSIMHIPNIVRLSDSTSVIQQRKHASNGKEDSNTRNITNTTAFILQNLNEHKPEAKYTVQNEPKIQLQPPQQSAQIKLDDKQKGIQMRYTPKSYFINLYSRPLKLTRDITDRLKQEKMLISNVKQTGLPIIRNSTIWNTFNRSHIQWQRRQVLEPAHQEKTKLIADYEYSSKNIKSLKSGINGFKITPTINRLENKSRAVMNNKNLEGLGGILGRRLINDWPQKIVFKNNSQPTRQLYQSASFQRDIEKGLKAKESNV